MPHMWGVVTASTALAATAASAALPPARSTATPADEARWSTEQTMPVGRVVGGQRSPVGHSVTVMANPSREIRPAARRRRSTSCAALIGADAVVTDPDLLAVGRGRLDRPVPGLDPGAAAARHGRRRSPAVLAWCDAAPGRPSCPRAATPGWSAAGVPLHGEVVLSLRRLDAIGAGRPARRPGDRRRRGDPGRRAGRRRRRTACSTRSTWPPATRPRSAARSPPTPAGSTCCAGAAPGAQLLGRRGGAGRRPGRLATSAGSRRTTPATTWPSCCAAARAPWPSSPRPGCGWCRPRADVAVALLAFADVADAVAAVAGCARRLPELEAAELITGRRRRPGVPTRSIGRRRSPGALAGRSCWSRSPDRRGRRPDRPARPVARWRVGRLDAVGDSAVAADERRSGRAVGLPRGPHAGHQHARPTPQARRDAAAGRAGRASSPRSPRGCAPSPRAPRSGCSATSATATSTST